MIFTRLDNKGICKMVIGGKSNSSQSNSNERNQFGKITLSAVMDGHQAGIMPFSF